MKNLLVVSILLISQVAFSQSENVLEGLKPVNGTSLYVKQMGEGEPLLVIHGGPGLSHDYFLPHMQALAENFTLILFDQRACGRSDTNVDASDITLNHFSRDIAGILDALRIERAHVLGHSFGGLLAMKFATEFPERTKSLILCNSVSGSKEFDELSKQKQQGVMTEDDNNARTKIFASNEFKNGSPASYEELFKVNFKRAFYDTLLIDELKLNLNENFSKTSRLLYGLGADLVAYDFHPALAKLNIPSLVIHGAADLIPIEVSEKLADTLQNGTLVVMEKSGHFPFIEEQKEFNKILTSFIINNENE